MSRDQKSCSGCTTLRTFEFSRPLNSWERGTKTSKLENQGTSMSRGSTAFSFHEICQLKEKEALEFSLVIKKVVGLKIGGSAKMLNTEQSM